MAEKYFTVEEVETLIPQLEDVMSGVMEHKRQVVEIGEHLAFMQEQMKYGYGNEVEPADLINKQTELDFLVKVINDSLQIIEALGGQPKDVDIGLVDFPTLIDGEEVLLCWKYGEKQIRFYHGVSEGFAGRKPISR